VKNRPEATAAKMMPKKAKEEGQKYPIQREIP
jgi:hypothetical protein